MRAHGPHVVAGDGRDPAGALWAAHNPPVPPVPVLYSQWAYGPDVLRRDGGDRGQFDTAQVIARTARDVRARDAAPGPAVPVHDRRLGAGATTANRVVAAHSPDVMRREGCHRNQSSLPSLLYRLPHVRGGARGGH